MCAHTDFQTYYITPKEKMNRTSCPCHFKALKLSKICTAVAPATAMRSDKYGNKIIMIRERAKKHLTKKQKTTKQRNSPHKKNLTEFKLKAPKNPRSNIQVLI